METSNTHILTRMSRLLAGIFLVTSLSCLTASSALFLGAQVTWNAGSSSRSPVLQSEGGAKILPTIGLHGAAMPKDETADATSQTLLMGMLLLLASFLAYAWHITRLHRELSYPPFWKRAMIWFERKLDEGMGLNRRAHS